MSRDSWLEEILRFAEHEETDEGYFQLNVLGETIDFRISKLDRPVSLIHEGEYEPVIQLIHGYFLGFFGSSIEYQWMARDYMHSIPLLQNLSACFEMMVIDFYSEDYNQLEHFFSSYPVWKWINIYFTRMTEVFSPQSKLYQAEYIQIDQHTATNVLRNFQGKRAVINHTIFEVLDLIEFINKWESGEAFHKLEYLKIEKRWGEIFQDHFLDAVGAKYIDPNRKPPTHTLPKLQVEDDRKLNTDPITSHAYVLNVSGKLGNFRHVEDDVLTMMADDGKMNTDPITSNTYVVRETDNHVASVQIQGGTFSFGKLINGGPRHSTESPVNDDFPPNSANQNPEVEVTLEMYRELVTATQNAKAGFQNQLLIISNLEEKLKEKAQTDKEAISTLEADLKKADILYETELNEKKNMLMASSSQGVPEPSSSNQAEKSVHMGHDMAQKRQMIAKKKYHKLRKNIRLFKKKMVHKMNRIRVNQKKEVRRLKAKVEKVNEAKREVEEAWDEGKAKMDGDGYFDNFGGKNEPPLGNLMKAMRRAQDLNIKLRKRGEKIMEELQYFKDRFRTIMDIVESKRINKEEKYNQMVKKFIEIQEKQDGVPSTLGPQPAKKSIALNTSNDVNRSKKSSLQLSRSECSLLKTPRENLEERLEKLKIDYNKAGKICKRMEKFIVKLKEEIEAKNSTVKKLLSEKKDLQSKLNRSIRNCDTFEEKLEDMEEENRKLIAQIAHLTKEKIKEIEHLEDKLKRYEEQYELSFITRNRLGVENRGFVKMSHDEVEEDKKKMLQELNETKERLESKVREVAVLEAKNSCLEEQSKLLAEMRKRLRAGIPGFDRMTINEVTSHILVTPTHEQLSGLDRSEC
ncbi:Protein CBG21421 [Caenorhabditis briggsae]|uniref:Protein CBG21421 n=1 Tax=Caenorhabditis briggsae TaxID=6238 RepID=A8Y013_CAEBR|nr:Protein CBG21421 [Caenorhabditis briggsae]CAP38230.1 Protein CBG21421 [Caenorhabditis briggsae]